MTFISLPLILDQILEHNKFEPWELWHLYRTLVLKLLRDLFWRCTIWIRVKSKFWLGPKSILSTTDVQHVNTARIASHHPIWVRSKITMMITIKTRIEQGGMFQNIWGFMYPFCIHFKRFPEFSRKVSELKTAKARPTRRNVEVETLETLETCPHEFVSNFESPLMLAFHSRALDPVFALEFRAAKFHPVVRRD